MQTSTTEIERALHVASAKLEAEHFRVTRQANMITAQRGAPPGSGILSAAGGSVEVLSIRLDPIGFGGSGSFMQLRLTQSVDYYPWTGMNPYNGVAPLCRESERIRRLVVDAIVDAQQHAPQESHS
jgi:hypothetical protein